VEAKLTWRESEEGIGELLRCDSPQIAEGGLSEPGSINIGWWAGHHIAVGPDPMGREHLFAMAAAARESSRDEDLVSLLWHVLAWGVVGNYRNAARLPAREAKHIFFLRCGQGRKRATGET
jgi:hypothetical protein